MTAPAEVMARERRLSVARTGLPVGAPGLMTLRPESIRILAPGTRAANEPEGVVESVQRAGIAAQSLLITFPFVAPPIATSLSLLFFLRQVDLDRSLATRGAGLARRR